VRTAHAANGGWCAVRTLRIATRLAAGKFGGKLRAEITKWAPVVKPAGAKVQESADFPAACY
jgi:hypothetical protein